MFLGMNAMCFDQLDIEKSVGFKKTLMKKEKVWISGMLEIYFSLETQANLGTL